MKLNMDKPIWVWLYDYGPYTHPQGWPKDCGVEAYPQAHTYAFSSEKDAREHPKNMNWSDDHKYVLQKTYLQEIQ